MDKNDMFEEEPYIPWYANEYKPGSASSKKVPDYLAFTPQDIKREIEKNVLNQEEACKKIAVLMYQHLHGHRFVGLLAGPTGSGKSYIAENLKKLFPDFVYLRDVSNVTCDGWKGNKKVSSLFSDVNETGSIQPVLFLDECDKMFSPKINSGLENVSESIQAEFLTVIHGGEIEVANRNETGREAYRTMNTRGMSFLFAGAFEKRAQAVAKQESGSSFGFGTSVKKLSSYDLELTMEDVREAGCTTELSGRIQKLICLQKFGEEEFRKMLDCNDRGPVREMEREFGIRIFISDRRKAELAHEAYVSGLGVRGMKNAIREYIDELTWENYRAKELEIA